MTFSIFICLCFPFKPWLYLQVCGSVRSEPCTPLQCEGGDLCPPAGTPLCKKDQTCVGALPLSKRADADVKNVKDQLGRLTKKITEAAEKVHTNSITHTHTHKDFFLFLTGLGLEARVGVEMGGAKHNK